MKAKECLLGLAFALAAGAVQAQGIPIQRSSVQLAGTASLTHDRDIDRDRGSTQLQVTPRIGYFVAQGLAVSANVQIVRSAGEGSSTTHWGFGPGITYYAAVGSRQVYPFLSGRTLFTWNRTNLEAPFTPRRVKASTQVWLLSGGALVMVGQHVGITAELFYQRERVAAQPAGLPQSVNSSETYGLQWGIAAFVF